MSILGHNAAMLGVGLWLDAGPRLVSEAVNTVAPVLSGGTEGGSVLSLSTGTWTDAVSYERRYLRGGTPISGQTGTSYTTGDADHLATVTGQVRAIDANGVPSAWVSSNGIAVAYSVPEITTDPVISPAVVIAGAVVSITAGVSNVGTVVTRLYLDGADVTASISGGNYTTPAYNATLSAVSTVTNPAGEDSATAVCSVLAVPADTPATTMDFEVPGSEPTSITVPPTILGEHSSTTTGTQFETATFTPSSAGALVIEIATLNDASTTVEQTLSQVTIGTAGRTAGTGTDITSKLKVRRFNVRSNAILLILENPAATAQTVQVTLGESSRATHVRVLEYIGANRTTQNGATATSAQNSNQTSHSVSLTTAGTGSVAHYFGTRMNVADAVVTSGATELQLSSTGASTSSTDLNSYSAYEAAATAGSYGMSASWTTTTSQALVAVEILVTA